MGASVAFAPPQKQPLQELSTYTFSNRCLALALQLHLSCAGPDLE